VILCDANLLLYAYDASAPQHARSRQWLEATLSGEEPVGIAWLTVLAFLRISTNPRALAHPLTLAEAAAIVSSWLARPGVTIPAPGPGHWDLLQRVLAGAQARGPLVTDAHLAALAIEHGAQLASADRDFARFQGLRFVNPLDAGAEPGRRE
jgi:toxin-antitoxin system PIN domain toxin